MPMSKIIGEISSSVLSIEWSRHVFIDRGEVLRRGGSSASLGVLRHVHERLHCMKVAEMRPRTIDALGQVCWSDAALEKEKWNIY